jgi:hypothetical protein
MDSCSLSIQLFNLHIKTLVTSAPVLENTIIITYKFYI